MLKKITIKNFKAIRELTIEFTPLTVLIGENSSGKSTVLQALDFLCSTASRDIDEYLKDREWKFNEIKSRFAGKDEPISFKSEFMINGKVITWEITINYVESKWIIRENYFDAEGELDLSVFFQFKVKSSLLKILDEHPDAPPASLELKKFLTSSKSFELLSPDRMRSNSRGKADYIGMGGENLAAYIHGMTPAKKRELSQTVSEFIGYPVEITAEEMAGSDLIEMFLEETWKQNPVKVKKRYISDGLLRIIAFSAILVGQSDPRKPKGLTLLDEIEDGINPALAEKLLSGFKKATEDKKSQFIVTSHSPVMVNYADEKDIQYMWRDEQGEIHCRQLFSTDEMKETLEFLYPGEVWQNYSKEDIIKKLTGSKEEQDA